MNKEMLYGIIGLLLGVLITMAVMAIKPTATSRTMMDADDMGMSMNDMMGGLQGKTGDEFDKAFIAEMIVHHQGAINMAKQAKQNAKHEEIKNLANDIISAQTKEITEMKQWQKNWGY